jgi:hypothetical protein
MTRCARSLGAAAWLCLSACGPVPGGHLSGTPAQPPADWSSVVESESGRELCEIESRPDDPHSIQLECFLYEGGLYAQSHRWALASWWPTTSWAAIWLEHPDVVVRLDDKLYSLKAVRVTDAAQRQKMLNERGYDPVPEGIVLFRFEPRSSSPGV